MKRQALRGESQRTYVGLGDEERKINNITWLERLYSCPRKPYAKFCKKNNSNRYLERYHKQVSELSIQILRMY